jgi:hypothetical protein
MFRQDGTNFLQIVARINDNCFMTLLIAEN